MNPSQSLLAFIFGAVGGLGVNIFRLYLLSHVPKNQRPDFDGVYWFQLIGLTLLGGAVALAHNLAKEINALVAINIGLSIPALVATSAGPAARTRKPKKTD